MTATWSMLITTSISPLPSLSLRTHIWDTFWDMKIKIYSCLIATSFYGSKNSHLAECREEKKRRGRRSGINVLASGSPSDFQWKFILLNGGKVVVVVVFVPMKWIFLLSSALVETSFEFLISFCSPFPHFCFLPPAQSFILARSPIMVIWSRHDCTKETLRG